MHTRRDFLLLTGSSLAAHAGEGAIHRKALVSRHSPYQTQLDVRSPFSVGNGEFAFTADITGLQPTNEKNAAAILRRTWPEGARTLESLMLHGGGPISRVVMKDAS